MRILEKNLLCASFSKHVLTFLADHSVSARLCALLSVYASYQRVIVNCARVLAKLSLTDDGRKQINENPENISYLVNVVVHEARKVKIIWINIKLLYYIILYYFSGWHMFKSIINVIITIYKH